MQQIAHDFSEDKIQAYLKDELEFLDKYDFSSISNQEFEEMFSKLLDILLTRNIKEAQ